MDMEAVAGNPVAGGARLNAFAELLGRSAADLVGSRHWVTYLVGEELSITHFLASNTSPKEREAYEQEFSLLDPLAPASCLTVGRTSAHLRSELNPEMPEHHRYEQGFLRQFGIVDALEIFVCAESGLTLGCSLLRHEGERPFSEQECSRPQALMPLSNYSLSLAFPRPQTRGADIAHRFPMLTARECLLVQLLVSGLNNKQLARELNISLATVKTHLLNIFRKTGVNSRTELAARSLS